MDKDYIRKKRVAVDYAQVGVTRSTCSFCLDIVDAQRIIRDDKIYLRKFCPKHGFHEAFAYSDAQWYLETLSSPQPGSYPFEISTSAEKGCPYDCGLCQTHQQHTCVFIVDITDYCPLKCPVCFAYNQNSYFMSLKEFECILDNIIRCEGHLEARALSLSGGEPTAHPQMFDMVKMALDRKPYINRVVINTAGLKIAQDEEFVHKLAELGAEIDIQFDGYTSETYKTLRGKDLSEIKFKAMENLEKYQVGTNVFITLAKYVNDHELGKIVLGFIPKKFVQSIVIQPIIHTGSGLMTYQIDPMDRITTPDAIEILLNQGRGIFCKSDFTHVPCSNPNCGTVTYIFSPNEETIIPLSKLFGQERYEKLLTNEFLLPMGKLVRMAKEVVNELDPEIRKDLESLFKGTCPCCESLGNMPKNRDKNFKLISIHSFMDKYTFDIHRLMRCCTVYTFPDKRIIPFCAYNTLYRQNNDKYKLQPIKI